MYQQKDAGQRRSVEKLQPQAAARTDLRLTAAACVAAPIVSSLARSNSRLHSHHILHVPACTTAPTENRDFSSLVISISQRLTLALVHTSVGSPGLPAETSRPSSNLHDSKALPLHITRQHVRPSSRKEVERSIPVRRPACAKRGRCNQRRAGQI